MIAVRSHCAECASPLPYVCEMCRGGGLLPLVRVGTKVARDERQCPACKGVGRLSADAAVAVAAVDSVTSARYGVMIGEPRYVAQARAIGEPRVLGLFSRLVAIVERRTRERGES